MNNNYLLLGIVALCAVGIFYLLSTSSETSPSSVFEVTEAPPLNTETRETTASSPKSTVTSAPAKTSTTVSQAGKRTFEKGVYVTRIEYGAKGFTPSSLTIKAGEEVRFVNMTNLTMHIIADEKNTSTGYRGINQSNTVGKNGTYQLGFSQVGVLFYYNLSNPQAKGSITITLQK